MSHANPRFLSLLNHERARESLKEQRRNGLGHLAKLTLNLSTSSIFACLPVKTQVWKNEGATDTPKASAVIPVCACLELV